MNELSQCSTRPTRRGWALGAAGIALALCACTHDGRDDVKPTDTTAYYSTEPAAQPQGTSTAPIRQPKE